MNIQPSFSLFLALLLALVFGVAYNLLVTRLNRCGDTEPYTAILVVGGVLITLAFTALFIPRRAALITVAFFIATGAPMMIGDIVRYMRKRERGRKLLK